MMVELIIKLLESKNYSRRNKRIQIEDVAFEFDGILVGPEQQDTLILVTNSNPIENSLRKVKAFSTVLRRSGSNRLFKLIFIADEIKGPTRHKLERLCHLITIPTNTSEENLSKYLCCLFPLNLEIEQRDTHLSVERTLKEELKNYANEPLVELLLKAAKKNGREVEVAALDSINNLLT